MKHETRTRRTFSVLPVMALAAAMSVAVSDDLETKSIEAVADDNPAALADWGSYWRPFSPDSPWNSRPVSPVLDDFELPKSDYFPSVAEGTWSTGVFLAEAGDQPVTVGGVPGSKGLWNPDAETFQDVTIPRWPAEVSAAAGKDGHADIVDPLTGIVHSFFQLRFQEGKWTAGHYAWTRLDGRGWGDPAHYFQGSRAAAVPAMAGLIRKHEISDGQPFYRHALAMSLTFNGMSSNPSFVFPATSADRGASANFGQVPEGALMMLPPSFDAQKIANRDLRKVAETLKVYGAYVVDRNHGTPFSIYVENGAGFNLHRGGWNSTVAADLDRMRQALRQVASTQGWVDGNGRRFYPQKSLNLLSMRGPWRVESGEALGVFDTWQQAVVFPEVSTRTVQANDTSRNMSPVNWAIPRAGTSVQLTAIATGGAKLRLQLRDRASGAVVVDSRELGNGESVKFAWPSQPIGVVVKAISGIGEASSIRGTLVAIN